MPITPTTLTCALNNGTEQSKSYYRQYQSNEQQVI